MSGKDEDIKWPSAIVACALIALVGAISVTALLRYSVDDALKVWAALGPVIGVITGAFVTYFFTRKAVEIEKKHTDVAEKKVANVRAHLARAAVDFPDEWSAIVRSDPMIADALR